MITAQEIDRAARRFADAMGGGFILPTTSMSSRIRCCGRPSGAPVASASGTFGRSFGTFQLTMPDGAGATIGTGIFSVLAQAVPEPAWGVIVSFIIAGIAAGLAAICYAELLPPCRFPGRRTFTHTTLGEAVAMVVAACLLLEYGVANAAVAVG